MADQCACRCNVAAPERYHDLACFIWFGWVSSPLDAFIAALMHPLPYQNAREQCTGLNLALNEFNVDLRIRYQTLPYYVGSLNILDPDLRVGTTGAQGGGTGAVVGGEVRSEKVQ